MLRKKYLVAASWVVGVPPRQIKEQIGGHAHQLQADEEEHQLVGRGDQHGPGVHDQQGAEELPRAIVGGLIVRQPHHDQAGQQQHDPRPEGQGVVQGDGRVDVGLCDGAVESIHRATARSAPGRKQRQTAARHQRRAAARKKGRCRHHADAGQEQDDLGEEDQRRLSRRLVSVGTHRHWPFWDVLPGVDVLLWAACLGCSWPLTPCSRLPWFCAPPDRRAAHGVLGRAGDVRLDLDAPARAGFARSGR